MAAEWSLDGSVCPICTGPGRGSTRYPAALCETCHASVRDWAGRPVDTFNEGLSGGLEIRTSSGRLTSPEAEKLPYLSATSNVALESIALGAWSYSRSKLGGLRTAER
jgi:hypothetical protein